MAIQKAITHSSGVVLANAYHKVLDVMMIKRTGMEMIEFSVEIFKDSSAKEALKDPIKIMHRIIVMDKYPNAEFTAFFDIAVLNELDVNVIKQCYEWMKTQSNLEGIDYTDSITDV